MCESAAGSKRVFTEKFKVERKKDFEEMFPEFRVMFPEERDVVWDQGASVYRAPLASPDDDAVLERYKNFKKFDTVDDHSDHLLMRNPYILRRYPLFEQRFWTQIKEGLELTERIYVRGYESMPDFLRAVIIGAEGTPYHDGLFFFDLCFPLGYGARCSAIPHLWFRSAGLSIHPDITSTGYISFLYGLTPEQRHFTCHCTIIELLVFLRDEYLVAKPFPGKRIGPKSPFIEFLSVLYNEETIIRSLKTMVHLMNHPPLHFEDLVVGHFQSRAHKILTACKGYMEGRFLDGKEEEWCSLAFRNDVASCIKPLVYSFVRIGAKGAENFLPLSEKKFHLPSEPTIRVNVSASSASEQVKDDSVAIKVGDASRHEQNKVSQKKTRVPLRAGARRPRKK